MTKGLDERWSDTNIIPTDTPGELIERMGLHGNHYGAIIQDIDTEPEQESYVSNPHSNCYLYIDFHLIR